MPLWRRPPLRAVQNSQHLHVIAHFVDGKERKRSEYEFASTFDAARASPIRKYVKCRDTFDDCLGNPTCGVLATLGDIVTDPFEIVGRVQRTRISRDSAGLCGRRLRRGLGGGLRALRDGLFRPPVGTTRRDRSS